MDLDTWWPLVPAATRDWLIAHNGEDLSAAVVADIAQVAGPLPVDAWWLGANGPTGVSLSDAGIDWVEAMANDEVPDQTPVD